MSRLPRFQPSSGTPPRGIVVEVPDADAVLGAVFDGRSGAINGAQLALFARRLAHLLPPLGDNPGWTRTRRQEQLAGVLDRIATIAEGGTPGQAQFALQVRDLFAQAAACAAKLQRSLRGSRIRRLTPDPARAEIYGCLAALLEECKRAHLAGAGVPVWDEHAQHAAAQIGKRVPGMATKSSGAFLQTMRGGGVNFDMGLTHVDVKGARDDVLLCDDDRNLNRWKATTVKAGAGIGNAIGWLGKFKVDGSVVVSAGRHFYEAGSLTDMVKLEGQRDAKHTWTPSAGPKTRRMMKTAQKLDAFFDRATGRQLSVTPGRPDYAGPAKIGKGLNGHNTKALAARLDTLGGTTHFAQLMGAAYPSIEDRLQTEVDAGGAVLPSDPLRLAMPKPNSFATQGIPFRKLTGQVDASAGLDFKGVPKAVKDATAAETKDGKEPERAAPSDVGIKAEMAGQVQLSTTTFKVNEPKLSHQLLTTEHSNDFAEVFPLYERLDALRRTGTDATHGPLLHLYGGVANQLAGDDAVPLALSASDALHYGELTRIPAQFRGSIGAASLEKLTAVQRTCDELTSRYVELVGHAATLLAKSNRRMSDTERAALKAARQEAFEAINRDIWNDTITDGAAVLGDRSRAERLIARSVDEISLALGCAGMHLSLLKRGVAAQVAARAVPPVDESGAGPSTAVADTAAGARTAIEQADAAYDRSCRVLDGGYLALPSEALWNATSLVPETIWRRHEVAASLKGTLGTSADPLGSLAKQADPEGLHGVEVDNSLAMLIGSVKIQVQRADRQPNASRVGTFVQFTVSVQGGAPVLGVGVVEGLVRLLRRAHPGAPPEKLQYEALDIVRQLQGMVLDVADGASLVIKLRKPDVGNTGFDRQFHRVVVDQRGGVSLKVPVVPTPAGIVSLTMQNKDTAQHATGVDIYGPDLSYLMMQHEVLTSLLGQQTGERSLAEVFADPANASALNSYFGNGRTISTVIDRFIACREAMDTAQANGTPFSDVRATNEFFRYYAHEFAHLAEVAKQAAHDAPGRSARDGVDPLQPAGSHVADALGLPEDFDWDGAKTRIAGLHTVQERAAYFAGTEGELVLQAFANIVGTTKKINAAAISHVQKRQFGIHVSLRDHAAEKGAAEQLREDAGQKKPGLGRRMNLAWNRQAAFAARLNDSELELLQNHREDDVREAVRNELAYRAAQRQSRG